MSNFVLPVSAVKYADYDLWKMDCTVFCSGMPRIHNGRLFTIDAGHGEVAARWNGETKTGYIESKYVK